MTKCIAAVALLAAATLSGCTTTSVVEAPSESAIPAAFPASAISSSAKLLHWSKYMPDLNLQEILDLAIAGNHDLRLAAVNLAKVQAQWGHSLNLGAPSVGIDASGRRSGSFSDSQTSISADLELSSWELDLFGKLKSLSEAAFMDYLATEEAKQVVKTALAAGVAKNWFALQAEQELESIAKASLAAAEERYILSEASFSVGLISRPELIAAQKNVTSTSSELSAISQQLKLRKNALELLLGQPLPSHLVDGLKYQNLSDQATRAHVPEGLTSASLLSRSDVKRAEYRLMAASARIEAARAAFFPSISLTGRFGTVSSELSDLFKGGTWGFGLGPSVHVPIFDGGRLKYNLRISKLEQDEALLQYELTIKKAFTEVADGLIHRDALLRQLLLAKNQLISDQESLELAVRSWQQGATAKPAVLAAEVAVNSSKQQVLRLYSDLLANEFQLYTALGGSV